MADGEELPEGYLLCDGAEVLKSEYAKLYKAIGNICGTPSDSDHFLLPDLRGKTVWGGNDSSSIGDELDAGLPNITGDTTIFYGNSGAKGLVGMQATGAFSTNMTSGSEYLMSTSYSASRYYYNDSFDASKANSIYSDDVNTVQPPAITVLFLIKAFSSSDNPSGVISLDNTNINVSYKDTFTIIYPNNGKEESPANVTTNSRYVMENPFPGYYVKCIAEIKYNNQWGDPGWIYEYSSYFGCGVVAKQLDDNNIIIQTGYGRLTYDGSIKQGDPFGKPEGTGQVTSECRVKVWKVGKINSDIPDIQEVEVVNVIEKVNDKIGVSYRDTFTYIYPNGGSEDSPANISNNSRYVMDNPFPGYMVQCQAELYYNNEWGVVPFSEYVSDRAYATGCYCFQHNDSDIVLTTGRFYLLVSDDVNNGKFTVNQNTFASVTSAINILPCRIKVWKVGKIDADVPDLQEVVTVLEKPKTVTTVTYEDTFTIIYPNGGSEESPANITSNTRYVETNPFPGYIVNCVVEILYNNEWGNPCYNDSSWYNGNASAQSEGTIANQFNDDNIVIRTGSGYVADPPDRTGNPFLTMGTLVSAPCRVKVWKVGKLDSSVPDLQEVSVHNTITVDEDQYIANSFTIVYPNNSTAESPATITNNSTYIVNNPFPGYDVDAKVELYYNNEWGESIYTFWSSNPYTCGALVMQHNDDKIMIVTGTQSLIYGNSNRSSLPHSWSAAPSTHQYTLPCRVKVWKVGKAPK